MCQSMNVRRQNNMLERGHLQVQAMAFEPITFGDAFMEMLTSSEDVRC